MSKILLVQVGSTVPRLVPRRGDFDDWFRAGLAPRELAVIKPHEGDTLPPEDAVRDYPAVVVPGSRSGP